MTEKNDKIELKEKLNRFRNMMIAALPKFQHLLPKTLTPNRLIELTMLGISKNPRIFQCSTDSIYKAFLDSAAVGLEIGSYQQLSCLVPYWNSTSNRYEARFQVMYRGHIKLFYENDGIYLDSQVVYQNDDFDYGMGSTQFVKHKPALINRGNIIAVYTIARKEGEIIKIEIMNLEQVYKIRNKSKTYQDYLAKKIDTCIWITDEEEMFRKTGINRIQKYMPLSAKTREIIGKDNEIEYEGIQDILDIPEISTEETQQRAIDGPQRKSKEKTKESIDDIPEIQKYISPSPDGQTSGIPPQEAPPLPQPQGGASPITIEPTPMQTLIAKVKLTPTITSLNNLLKVFSYAVEKSTAEEKETLHEWVNKRREELKGK